MDDVLRLPEPVLVVLVGPSASGKSAWAAEHFAADQVVSSDRLRAVVGDGEHDLAASSDAFGLLDAVLVARTRRRLTTVVDTLGLDPQLRARWRHLAAEAEVPCIAVLFDTTAAECRRRNASRHHRVPDPVLREQLARYAAQRHLVVNEPFDEVVVAQPVRVVPASIAAAARASGASRAPAEPSERREVRMRVGLHLSTWDVPSGAAQLRQAVQRVAAAAEEAGLDSIWVMDHFRQIPQLGRAWDDMLESATTLGYLAAATDRVDLGCLVNGVTHRNVGVLAKQVATLDVLSGGRAWCGLGAAWFEAEHRAFGLEFPTARERLDLLEDALQALPLLWGPGSPSFTGRRTEIPEALAYPRPLRGRVPILVGGSGERRTLRLAAQYADACNLFGDPDTVRHKVSVLHSHCRDVGRAVEDVEVTHLSTMLVAPDASSLGAEVERRQPARGAQRWRAAVVPGTVDDHVLRLKALHDAGVQHALVRLVGVWDTQAVALLGQVAAALRHV